MCIEGEDIVFDLILTKSGHYVLPLDTFKESMVKRAEHKSGNQKLRLFNNREIEDQEIEEETLLPPSCEPLLQFRTGHGRRDRGR